MAVTLPPMLRSLIACLIVWPTDVAVSLLHFCDFVVVGHAPLPLPSDFLRIVILILKLCPTWLAFVVAISSRCSLVEITMVASQKSTLINSSLLAVC